MPKLRKRLIPPGFTMLELAIVLIIMGIIAGVTIPSVITAIKKEKISTARENLASVRQSIIAFAIANRRLPTKDSAEDPTRNLKDVWGRAYTYFPARELAVTDADLCVMTTTNLSISTQAGVTTPGVAFLLMSTGPDGAAGVQAAEPTINAVAPGDDIYDVTGFNQLYRIVCSQTVGSLGPVTAQGFAGRNAVVTTPGTKVGVTVMPDGSVVMGFTDAQQAAASGTGASNYSYGCIWYTGNAAGCTLGNCTLVNGLRAYFTFTMVRPATYAGQLADGFTFTVASANTNQFGSCGGKGSAMGYASGYWYYPDDAGNAPFLVSPKIGVEFDPFRCFGDRGVDGNCDSNANCGMGGTGDYDHVAIVYWGDENSAWGSSGTVDGRRSRDDNTHNSPTLASDTTPKNPVCDAYSSSNQNGFLNLNSGTWFLNNAATEIPVRVEIKRTNPTASAGTYKTTVWFNCQNCSDVTSNSTTFNALATLNSTVTLSTALTQQFKNVIFGFTEGTGGSRQRVTLRSQSALFY
jgi:prepilin-type N-terminal cleavage/methylation domain-containing protein